MYKLQQQQKSSRNTKQFVDGFLFSMLLLSAAVFFCIYRECSIATSFFEYLCTTQLFYANHQLNRAGYTTIIYLLNLNNTQNMLDPRLRENNK